jgi:hypothetical protein
VDVRVSGSLKIGFIGLQFPKIIIRRISRLTDYQMNVQLPDTLFAQEESVTIDSSMIAHDPDSVFTANPEVVPLSSEEETAYGELDSTMTLEKAYRPTGPLARFVKFETDDKDQEKKSNKIFSDLSPILGFDRVDALTLGIKKSFSPSAFDFGFFAGYKTGRNDWFYGGEMKFTIGSAKRWQTVLKFSENSDTRYQSRLYPMLFSSVHTLLGYRDYFDYYRNRKWQLKISYGLSLINSRLSLAVNDENHHNLVKSTDFNILGRNISQRENPAIPEGRLRSLEIRFNNSQEYAPFGIIGQNYWQFLLEYSHPDLFNSEFDFLRVEAALDFRINTFLRRRMLPNTLDIQLLVGNSSGTLPPQRFGIVDGALQIFGPYGSMRTLIGRPYEGEKYAGIYWEHNFRTVPFEILGFRSIVTRNIGIIIYGASSKSWIEEETKQRLFFDPVYPDNFHHEIGLAINGIIDLFRLDFTQRLDQSEFYIGISFSRLF